MKKTKIISYKDDEIIDFIILPELSLMFQKAGWSITFGWLFWRLEIITFYKSK